ncbi:hypothetical protein [Pelotomaculum sp. FP]|nr:hypothetical protein [Pelotomaculum sp. FP]
MLRFIEIGKNEGYVNKNISTEAIMIYLKAFETMKRSEVLAGELTTLIF